VSPILGIWASQNYSRYSITGSYESIATVTVGSGGSSTITFSSIPSTYTHLQIRALARTAGSSTGGTSWALRYNSASSNYARHNISGDGSSASADNGTNETYGYLESLATGGLTASVFGSIVIDILDYANTNKYKTVRSLAGWDNNGSGRIVLTSHLYQSTSAISQIDITAGNTQDYVQYSHFALYGIKGA
jgi:hypothetical protein